jgi:hypothetical protein
MATQFSAEARKRTIPPWRLVSFRGVALLTTAALVAACGSGGSNGVASSSSNRPSAQSPGRRNGVRFASCIRAHGIPNFPDSAVSAIGQFETNVPRYLKAEPQFRSAVHACQRDLPGGGAAAKHVNVEQELTFANCMRSHGITDFPDPMPGGGFNIPGNTNSPQFEAADNACQRRSSSRDSAASNGS